MMNETPHQLGYRMPAEWEPHEATWLAWPHNPEDWPGKFQPIPWIYAEIVRLLSARERVYILAEDAKAEQRAASMLERAGANLGGLGDVHGFHRYFPRAGAERSMIRVCRGTGKDSDHVSGVSSGA